MIGNILSILDWLKDRIPLGKRVETIKNNIDKLERERSEILLHKAEVRLANRLVAIDKQLLILRRRLQNCAQD